MREFEGKKLLILGGNPETSALVRVANNMEGTFALSEEFSHLMIGTFRNENLIQRSLKQLQSNEQLLKDILGNDY